MGDKGIIIEHLLVSLSKEFIPKHYLESLLKRFFQH